MYHKKKCNAFGAIAFVANLVVSVHAYDYYHDPYYEYEDPCTADHTHYYEYERYHCSSSVRDIIGILVWIAFMVGGGFLAYHFWRRSRIIAMQNRTVVPVAVEAPVAVTPVAATPVHFSETVSAVASPIPYDGATPTVQATPITGTISNGSGHPVVMAQPLDSSENNTRNLPVANATYNNMPMAGAFL